MINDKSGSQITYRPQLTGLKRVLINLKKHLKVVKAMSRRQIGPKICAKSVRFLRSFFIRNREGRFYPGSVANSRELMGS